ncbi:MAG: hypothetical protein HUJ68_00775 [Clostridia bacterium]|nr:hypothetical protein [Clostridia bacterium]
MIFVTLGTQDKTFPRLIQAVERQVELGNIKEEVIVQSGSTNYESDKIKIINFMSKEEHSKNLKDADLIITHAGAGTIIEALEMNKVVIAGARKKEFGEHVNNHQEQLLENFSQAGYVLALNDFNKLDEVIKCAKDFNPNKFKHNNENFNQKLLDEINFLLMDK